MDPIFEHLSAFTWMDILGSKEKSISFLQRFGLLPIMDDSWAPAECPKCSSPMTYYQPKTYVVLGWRWICQKFRKKKDRCRATVKPLEGTLFEDLKIPFMDVLALIFGYIMQIGVTAIKDHLDCWRRSRKEREIGQNTVVKFYSVFDKVILHSLAEEAENFKKRYIDREKLLKAYTMKLNAEPCFRNIVFQFLMDMKTQYPLKKTASVSASDTETNASSSAKDISSSKISASNGDDSTVLKKSDAIISDTSNPTVSNASGSIILNSSNETVLDMPRTTVSNTLNSTVSLIPNSTDINLSNSNNSGLVETTLSPILNHSSVSVENKSTKVKNDASCTFACVSKKDQSVNTHASKNVSSPDYLSTNIANNSGFIENVHNTKTGNVETLNNAFHSSDVSFATTRKSLSNNINSSVLNTSNSTVQDKSNAIVFNETVPEKPNSTIMDISDSTVLNTSNSTDVIMTVNNASPSSNISFPTPTKSFSDNSISDSSPSKVLDIIAYQNNLIMDINMDVDHDEIVTTSYNND